MKIQRKIKGARRPILTRQQAAAFRVAMMDDGEISLLLGVSVSEVRRLLYAVMRKLNVRRRRHLCYMLGVHEALLGACEPRPLAVIPGHPSTLSKLT